MKGIKNGSRWFLLVVFATAMIDAGKMAKADFVFGEATEVPNINSNSYDAVPQISRDGLELYFTSSRQKTPNGCNPIWVSRRATVDDQWSTPVPLEFSDNFDGPQYNPSISGDGLELYFADSGDCTANPGGYGQSDIWVSKRQSKDDPWGTPQNLGQLVNTWQYEDAPSISADGLELYFMINPTNGPKNSEILVTTRLTKDDPWGEPVNLGPNVNSGQYEYMPVISPDGLSLFFSRGFSKAQAYVSRRAKTAEPWGPAEFFAPVNSGTDPWDPAGKTEFNVTFSGEDSAIYFCRGSSLFAGDYNIWQVPVVPMLDFNADMTIDAVDLIILVDHLGTEDSLYDISPIPFGDGKVDGKDIKAFYRYADNRLVIPTPFFGAANVDPNTSLSWTATDFAQAYDVFFGTSSAEVAEAGREHPMNVLVSLGQDANYYEPTELLEPGRTYYWRIDEVNMTSQTDTITGMVWHFTTPTLPWLIENITATASSSERLSPPTKTSDGSGLDRRNTHSTEPDTMWLSTAGGAQPTWIQYEFDAIYPLGTMWVWNYNDAYEYFLGFGFKDVTIEYSEDGQVWTLFGDVQFAQGVSANDYGYNTTIDFGGLPAKYVRLTALSNWGGLAPQCGLSEVQFFSIPPTSDETEKSN